jgi:predicted secreted protein
MRKLALSADEETHPNMHKHAAQFNAGLKKDAAQYPTCDLSAIKPIHFE